MWFHDPHVTASYMKHWWVKNQLMDEVVTCGCCLGTNWYYLQGNNCWVFFFFFCLAGCTCGNGKRPGWFDKQYDCTGYQVDKLMVLWCSMSCTTPFLTSFKWDTFVLPLYFILCMCVCVFAGHVWSNNYVISLILFIIYLESSY